MAEKPDEIDYSLLSRAEDGFLPLDEILERATLQAARVDDADLHKVRSPPSSEQVQPASVLVVDDEEAVRNVVTRNLQRKGYRAFSVASGEEALASFRSQLPHAVVTDVKMPGMDGVRFLDEAMKRHPDTVIIMTTGAPDMQMTMQALRAGATDFLVKPIDFGVLHAALERGLERRRMRLDQRRYQLTLEQTVEERTRRLIESFERLQQKTREISAAYRDVVIRLGRASEWRDDETGEHIQRIGLFSAEIARKLGLSRTDVELIAEASPMHDIGKIGVPDSILLKPGKLTPLEYEYMKAHTLIGAEVLSGSDAPLLRASEQIALSHHEWINGSGYPQGLKGEEIPLYARIVAVVDVYDAMTHERAYKEAVPLDETIEIMSRKRGRQFDPEIFDAFLNSVTELVRLEKAMAARPKRTPNYDVEIGIFKMARHVRETFHGTGVGGDPERDLKHRR